MSKESRNAVLDAFFCEEGDKEEFELTPGYCVAYFTKEQFIKLYEKLLGEKYDGVLTAGKFVDTREALDTAISDDEIFHEAYYKIIEEAISRIIGEEYINTVE